MLYFILLYGMYVFLFVVSGIADYIVFLLDFC